jgi:hypothetical protein
MIKWRLAWRYNSRPILPLFQYRAAKRSSHAPLASVRHDHTIFLAYIYIYIYIYIYAYVRSYSSRNKQRPCSSTAVTVHILDRRKRYPARIGGHLASVLATASMLRDVRASGCALRHGLGSLRWSQSVRDVIAGELTQTLALTLHITGLMILPVNLFAFNYIFIVLLISGPV